MLNEGKALDMDVSALLKKYDVPAPRYTSYPTAVHFNDEITQNHYSNELSALSSDKSVSLYVHIPFCHILCHYCGCNTKVANSYGPAEEYLKTLFKEIDLTGKALSHRVPVSHLHFGGGSPNFLKGEDLQRIRNKLAEYFDFNEDSEIAIETDPRLMNKEKIQGLADAGFTRVSLGVQDFDPKVQKAMNRIQPFETVEETVLGLRKSGIDKINFDLMIGLPLQTLEIVRRNVELALSLSPNRFAVFAYAHVPWMKKHQKLLEQYEMPGTQMRFDMGMVIKETLEGAGYKAIGIDHFVREDDHLYQTFKTGDLRRNFQGYTDDQAQTIIGFGVSSITSFEGSYVQKATGAPEYRSDIENDQFPIMRGCILTGEDKVRRSLIEQIMCGYRTDISAYPETRASLRQFEGEGIIQIDGDTIQITDRGWPFARMVAACFDTYYVPQEGQHAKAI